MTTAPTLTEVTTPDRLTYLVSPAGFPCDRCPKCSGHGEIPAYNHRHKGICYLCNGAGLLYPKTKAGNIARDYLALARIERIDTNSIEPGMTFRLWGGTRQRDGSIEPWPWQTAKWVKTTALLTGWSVRDGVMDLTYATRERVVLCTDGTVVRLWGQSLESRKDVEAVEAARQQMSQLAREQHEKLLRRRQARQLAGVC